MDAMLGFAVRGSGFEPVAEQAGWGYFKCRRIKEAPVGLEHFSVLASDAPEFDDQVQEVEAFLRAHRDVIENLRRQSLVHLQLIFGTGCECVDFVENHRFHPSFLALLAQLEIELNVSVYAAEPPDYLRELGCRGEE